MCIRDSVIIIQLPQIIGKPLVFYCQQPEKGGFPGSLTAHQTEHDFKLAAGGEYPVNGSQKEQPQCLMGIFLSLIHIYVELLCENLPVASGLIEHIDEIAVLKDVLNLAAGQQVFDVLRDPGGDAAPFAIALPDLDTVPSLSLIHI